jgi:hypothetical protein
MQLLRHHGFLDGGVRVRGVAIAATRSFVKERFGADAWLQLLGRLPRYTSAVVDGLFLPDAWYPAAPYEDFLNEVLRSFGGLSLGVEIGRRVAQADLRQQLFVDGARDPHVRMGEAPRLWNEYVSVGTMRVVARHADGLELTLDNPGLHPIICGEMVVGFGNEVLQKAGVTVHANVHTRCVLDGDPVCGYAIRWR